MITVTGSFIQGIDLATGKNHMVYVDSAPRRYNQILQLVLANKHKEALSLMVEGVEDEIVDVDEIRKRVAAEVLSKATKGRFVLKGNISDRNKKLYYTNSKSEEVEISGRFFDRVLECFVNDNSVEVLDKFLSKVESNAFSDVAANDLFNFLAVNGHPLTTDGDFLAFKIVRDDLKDFHSGTVMHEVGSIVALDPSQVDFDRSRTCSKGLHFCSRDYLPQYGGSFGDKTKCALLILKINPANVAAFPRDYKDAKGRAVQYHVLARIPNDRYHHVINHVLSQTVVDVSKDLTDINAVASPTYQKFTAVDFEDRIEDITTKKVQTLTAAAGPVPTVATSRWVVASRNVATGRSTVVANATSRSHARELAKQYNTDYGNGTVTYRVIDTDSGTVA